jgi:hypothetical protein
LTDALGNSRNFCVIDAARRVVENDMTGAPTSMVWKPFCKNIPTNVISFSTINDMAERSSKARAPTVNATTVT